MMKDIKQTIIIVLLVIVIIGMAVIYSGQKNLENRLNQRMSSVESTVYSSTSGLSYQLSEQVRQALLSEKFLVVDTNTEFSKAIVRGEAIECDIYFTLIENKDIEKLYVIIEDDSNSVIKAEAEDAGNLRYKVHINFDDAKSYQYYVLGVDAQGEEMMLSNKSYLDLSGIVYERAYLYMDSAGATSGSMYYKGLLSVHQKFEIETVDIQFVHVEDYKYMDSDDVEVKKTIDVTEFFSETTRYDIENIDMYYNDLYDAYHYYKMDIEYTAEEGEDLLVDPYVDYRLVVTFTDGSSTILY